MTDYMKESVEMVVSSFIKMTPEEEKDICQAIIDEALDHNDDALWDAWESRRKIDSTYAQKAIAEAIMKYSTSEFKSMIAEDIKTQIIC